MVIFALLDTGTNPGTPLNSDPIQIQTHNTDFMYNIAVQPKSFGNKKSASTALLDK